MQNNDSEKFSATSLSIVAMPIAYAQPRKQRASWIWRRRTTWTMPATPHGHARAPANKAAAQSVAAFIRDIRLAIDIIFSRKLEMPVSVSD